MDNKGTGSWRKQAEALFFYDHLKIKEIAAVVCRTDETVSNYLSGLPGYKGEKMRRKEQSKKARKEYQRQWNKDNRPYNKITAESLRREHETAMRILSAEKY